ncbi:MAG: GDP-mannose 4,6-dehydratase, partial [Flavobacteriales bacterium]
FANTFGLPILISHSSNNYGPGQNEEKLIPSIIRKAIDKEKLPVYGKGENIRDWLWVFDHVAAIDLIFHNAEPGKKYNISSGERMKNIELVKLICSIIDDKLKRNKGETEKLIEFVSDRPGHDLRYAVDSDKIRNELGWEAKTGIRKGLEKTIDHYLIS